MDEGCATYKWYAETKGFIEKNLRVRFPMVQKFFEPGDYPSRLHIDRYQTENLYWNIADPSRALAINPRLLVAMYEDGAGSDGP